MLLFSELPDPAAIFPDHQDPVLRYYLPEGLEIACNADGEPEFFLLRYHGDFAAAVGGLLRFRLAFSPPSPALLEQVKSSRMRAVGFDRARFRLRLRSLQEGVPDETSEWRTAGLAGLEVASPAAGLTTREAELLQRLLEDGISVVEVDLDLRYQGLVPGLPWLATAHLAELRSLLAALLPEEAARQDQVVAAFLSLPEDSGGIIRWHPLEPGVDQPDQKQLLEEVALRSMDRLFEREGPGNGFEPVHYQLRPADAGEPHDLSWDLGTYRLAERGAALTWSVSDFYKSLEGESAQKKLFPVVSQVSPFAEVDVHLVNRLLFDAAYLKRATVEVRCPGPQGVVEYRSFTFDGRQEVQKFTTFYPAVTTDFWLEYSLNTVLAPPGGSGWPVIKQMEFQRAEGLLIELSRQVAGMDFVRVEAEPEVFEKAARVEVEILRPPPGDGANGSTTEEEDAPLARLSLTVDRPRAWVALLGVTQDDELYVRSLAYGFEQADQLPYVIREGPILDRRVKIAAYLLEVLEPDRITVHLNPDAADRFAYILVWLAPEAGEGRSFPLAAGAPIVWNVFRSSVFDPLCYRYRFEYVAYDADHRTLPAVVTDWMVSKSAQLVIIPPSPPECGEGGTAPPIPE